MTIVPQTAFKQKVLDPVRHLRLVDNIDFFAERAGIDPKWIWTSALTLTQEEISYLRNCRALYSSEGIVGGYYTGDDDVTERMALMAGALVRGFVDARMMSAQQLIDYAEAGSPPDATVLFCPNFFTSTEFGKFSERRVASLSSIFYERAALGQQMVLHFDDLEKAKQRFGGRFASLLTSRMGELKGYVAAV